ncbi:MAG: hypothetical protein J6K65_04830 [Alphaproteobacteria bacterium]|nr:hypothetical protein [Alphaproteobacteria bacterium]
MENLNDVEFGSDKNAEEAPILIAQRFLNIFRQVHIFNKAKRDQFDDELLALPQNIIDLIKGMPGGRLLIEHIEDVKTERGISFVKSKKEDFITEDNSTPSGNASQATVVQGGIGSVVMDASFAENLASSMAAAFKQLPVGAAPTATVPADFGKAFEVIAQEIRSSRASLLDVLKETRNITDSVIASQVSISKVLESLLAAQNKEKTDTAVLSDKIIASQTAITRMLEKMQTNSGELSNKTANYSDIDRKLQDFRNEIKGSVNISLQSLIERLYENSNKKDEKITDYLNVEHKLQAFKSEIRTDIDGSLNKMQTMLQDYAQAIRTVTANRGLEDHKRFAIKDTDDVISEPAASLLQTEDVVTSPSAEVFYQDSALNDTLKSEDQANQTLRVENRDTTGEGKIKKKKKKKKNSEPSFVSGLSAPEMVSGLSSIESIPLSDKQEDNLSIEDSIKENAENSIIEETTDLSSFDGVIRNDVYKHQDDFSNIKLDEAFLDNAAFDEVQSDKQAEPTISEDDLSVLDGLDSLDDFDFSPATADSLTHSANTSEVAANHFVTDNNLDFQEVSNHNDEPDMSALDSFADGLDFALPKQGASIKEEDDSVDEPDMSALDSFADGLDFALPEQGASVKEENDKVDEPDMSALDSFADGLDYALPEQGASVKEENDSVDEPDMSTLDSFADGLDFALPEQGASVKEEDDKIDVPDTNTLDSFADGLDFALPEQGASQEQQEDSSDELSTGALDSFMTIDTENALHSETDNTLDTLGSNEEPAPLDDLLSANIVSSSPEMQINEAVPAPNAASSRYSAELEKIRAALTSDNVDISSLDEPIALDEYSDDENLVEDEDSSYDLPDTTTPVLTEKNDVSDDSTSDDEDWEWEYVDENGNEVNEGSDDDQDWEWEYVEDDGAEDESDNNRQ